MDEYKVIEAVDLLYDFEYTIPGSKKGPIFLKAGERFRLIEKKSENWYSVSRLDTNDLFYVPVVYSRMVKLASKKPGVASPPSLPAKPKNLLEKLQNDLEIHPPSPPVIDESVKIELFKLLSALHPRSKSTNSLSAKSSLHKSDSHVDQIANDSKSIKAFDFDKNDTADQFNSLPKASLRLDSTSSDKDNYTNLNQPNSLRRPKPHHSSKSSLHSNPPLTPPKAPPPLHKLPTNTTIDPPPQFQNPLTATTTIDAPPPLQKPPTTTDPPPPLPPKPPPSLLQVYTDEATGKEYYHNPLTNQTAWVLAGDEEEGGAEKMNLSLDLSSDSMHTGSLELLEQHSSRPEDTKSEKLHLSKAGPLNRTKLTEGGRKLKKYWYCTYAVLEGSQLTFYKDQKSSAHKSKADLTLDLTQSFVLKGGTHNRQNIIQLIMHTKNEYLLQWNDEAEVDEWFSVLSHASTAAAAAAATTTVVDITNLPSVEKSSASTDESSTTTHDSFPPAAHTTGTLAQSTEKAKLMARLKTWLGKRPSQESLREKGIYKDGIFGSRLSLICEKEDTMIASFVSRCVREVEERGLDTDGIYRISGNMAEIQKLRLAVDSNATYDLSSADIHAVAGALKLFLRELQEPLIPFRHYHKIVDAYYSAQRLEEVKTLLQSFPECNYETLKYLLRHLLLVVSHCKENRMQVNNLSIIFGPTLLWPREPVEATKLASSLMARGQLLELLLMQFDALFVV